MIDGAPVTFLPTLAPAKGSGFGARVQDSGSRVEVSRLGVRLQGRGLACSLPIPAPAPEERETGFFIDNLLVRVHHTD